MNELSYTGEGIIALDGTGGVTVIVPPLTITDGMDLSIRLSVRNIFGHSGLVISPGDGWDTVYRDTKTGNLFITRGEWAEEGVRIFYPGPDDERSEITLEKVGVMDGTRSG